MNCPKSDEEPVYLHLKVYRELCRIRDEQKTFGKIYVNTEL